MAIMFNSYSRDWSWLSNFHPCVLKIALGGADGSLMQVFPSAEHLYQFCKWDRQGVPTAEVVRGAKALCGLEPAQARAFGKRIKVRPNWHDKKLRLMAQVLREKYAQNTHLAERLVATDDTLLWHLSPWDMYWGGTENRAGLNRLGMLTMAARDRLQGQ